MSTIDDLQRLHEAATPKVKALPIWRELMRTQMVEKGRAPFEDVSTPDVMMQSLVEFIPPRKEQAKADEDYFIALHNAWPAIHRVLVAARKMAAGNHADPLDLSHAWEFREALRALDGEAKP